MRYSERGNQYFDKGQYTQARLMYKRALQKDMRYGPAHYKLGLTEYKLGSFAVAAGEFQRAIDLTPASDPNSRLPLGCGSEDLRNVYRRGPRCARFERLAR